MKNQPLVQLVLMNGSAGFLLGILLACGCLTRSAHAKPGLEVQPTQEPTAWTIRYKNQKVLVYSFAPDKFKSYVKELYTLKGDNILRDAPHDHLHHHALMYAVRVNGLNFWEETSGCAVEKSIGTPKIELGFTACGREEVPQATLSHELRWVAAQDAFLPNTNRVTLLVEHRKLVLTLNPALQEVALEWKSQFEVGTKTNTVVLTGTTYNGLGMRFQQNLDALAVHSIGGLQPDLANNRQDISAAPWAAVSFDAPGHPATIALAGHPSNARGDATFFSMLTPFAYLSATQALNQEPLIYHAGDKFELNYLVLLYPEAKPSDTLRKHIEAWRQSKP
jgi:hypothetical protein